MQIVETKNSVGPGNIVLIEVGTCTGSPNSFADLAGWEQVPKASRRKLSRKRVLTWFPMLRWMSIWPINSCCRSLWRAVECSRPRLNRHARTNMDVISTFLPVSFATREESGRIRVEVTSRA